ncbi:MAG: glycosyltransferase family 1 protein [Candidatus Nanopelagicaceae bacterium]|nr:glycosyltransferase family 1 protein [Candidatus Nanopelagicaceae bacterium]
MNTLPLDAELRVAVVAESFLPQVNGVTNSVLRILEYFKANHINALVVVPETEKTPDTHNGFKVVKVPALAVKGLIPLAMPLQIALNEIEHFKPDVIHLASPALLGNYVTKYARKRNIPTLSVYQTDLAGFAKNYGLQIANSSLNRFVAKVHSNSDLTLAPSTSACNYLQGIGVSEIALWQRGVDSIHFNPSKRDESLRESFLGNRGDRTLIGYIGRLAHEKRLEDLISLSEQDDCQLLIVGDGPIRSRLERKLPNAIFTGVKTGEELASIYASLDIFIHTGQHETFCQSIQEALSSGVPVIAPNSGGPIDLVKNGETGYLINTGNPKEIRRVVNLIQESDKVELSSKARASVVGRDWNFINSQLIAHYLELIKSKDQTGTELVA